MAEIVASAVLTVLFEKMASVDLVTLARSEGLDTQLNKWKNTLQLIQAVLADAAQKHITQRAVELWLHDLQDLAYDIDDVLDDLATEALKRKLKQESHASTSKLFKIIPTCCTTFTPHNIMYGHQMSYKLDEITTKLNELFEQKNNLGLNVNVNVKVERSERRLEQTSLVDESKVLGREGDKEALLEKLLGDDASKQDVRVVAMVGLGGIGKTTLAKLLYNDEKVKDHFKLRAWVCVSDDFNVVSISKAIYQAVNGENKDFANLDLLHVALKKELSKKRFLVVLDDVWNEDHEQWELLQSPFVAGAPGSKIIITTRKIKVASVMNSIQPYNLKVLSDEISLSLIAQYALDEQNFDNFPSLKLIAKGIVQKCDGLPLALITLGRVLKTKGRSEDEWGEILNSEIWNLEDESHILPALKLSYYDLPSHLKQLFAYCSLFPKDYEFKKNELVILWMAEGFLSQSKGNKSMESLGHLYFEELQSRSFFQSSMNHKSGYTMHDLMNDLAISVAGEFFFMLDDKTDVNGRVEAFDKFRHFSFIGQRHAKFKEIHRAARLRTFLQVSLGVQYFSKWDNVPVDLLPRLQFLRVLSVSSPFITKVPQSIGSLKHLRYLNFSATRIKRLPEQVSDLYNLQSLLVRNCRELSSLPVSFVKLINLRHLDIYNTPLLKKMPLGIGRLTSLRTLSKVCIEAANGFKLSELKELSELEGQLSIKGLDKMIDPIEAKDANLVQKKGLEDLEMEWSEDFDKFRNLLIEFEVLEKLKPPSRLRSLKILFYGGMKYPSWIGDPLFDMLIQLSLRGCRCTHLPTLGLLSSLQSLHVGEMHEVKTVGFELLAPTKSSNHVTFPSLVSLSVNDMQGLEIWSTGGGDNDGTATSFLHLRRIHIRKCPKLAEVSFGLLPSLEFLHIDECSATVLRAMVSMSSSVRELRVMDIEGLMQLNGNDLKHLVAVEDLFISGCDELRYLWESEPEACKFLVRLQRLEVRGCKKLVSVGKKDVNVGSNMESLREVSLSDCETLESYKCPNRVERLQIFNCSSLTSLSFSTFPSSKNVPDGGIGFLPNLRLKYLQISKCNNLKSFHHEHLQSFAYLEVLSITECPNMDYSFPCGLWPPNLKTLRIGCLNKPMSEWGMQNYPTSLVHLSLYGEESGVVSFAVEEEGSNTTCTSTSFLLPPSLIFLGIYNFKNVKSLSEVLQRLTCLEDLTIHLCPKLRDVPETTSSLRVTVSNFQG